ncbi:MAG TPA: helix-turn-helix domain-containing protein [Segetibacter sp.]|nr:helix-turn-helix domain-containing protein [Segetibacter sp.]
MKSDQIPIFKPTEVGKHHFGDTEWKPIYSGFTNVFHINRIEDYVEHLKFPLPPHRKTVYDFIFLAQGESVRSKGLDKYEIKANTFFFLPPFQITTHQSMSPDSKGFYCHFDAEIMTKNYIQPGFLNTFPFLHFIGNPTVKIEEQAIDNVLYMLQRLEVEFKKTQPNFLFVTAYLLALLSEINLFAASTEKGKENAASRLTQQYKDALTKYVYEKQSVSEYADLLAVTPEHLNKCIKSVTGKSAHDLLSDIMLLEAKTLLRQTQLTISEIAFKVGKEDQSDFTRFFKSKSSLTPTQYRQMI